MPISKKYQDVIRQRLRDFIGVEGLLETSFIQTCGLANGWWSAQGLPAGTSLQKIKRRFPRLNMEWLFTGNGNMYVGFDEHQHVRPLEAPTPTMPTEKVSDITITLPTGETVTATTPQASGATNIAPQSVATPPPMSVASQSVATPPPTIGATSEATITLPREVYNLLLQQLQQKDATITSLLNVMQHPTVTQPSVTPGSKLTTQPTNNQKETDMK